VDVTSLVIQTIFWFLGFLFLFRIPQCKKSSKNRRTPALLSIIIPARNEEESLPHLLTSLQKNKGVAYEIIVVVGQSDDRTEEIATRSGVRTIKSAPLPKGWLGKSWACYQGAQVATGDLFIFLDADTLIEKNGLQKLLDTYRESDGVISVQPYHKTKRLYEQLSSFFNIILMGGMGNFTVLGNLIKPIGLFGPCVMMSRKQYLTSGGHLEVKDEVVEDLALGNKLKQQRVPIYGYSGKGTISFRMYPGGIGALTEGWSKNFATGATKTYIPLTLMIIAWIGGGISATINVIEAISDINSPLIFVWVAAYFAYAMQIYWMLIRIGTFRFYTALLYPIPLLFFLGVFSRSLILIFIMKRVRWKGVTISLKDR
jgi:4,4'-diaponeurosporenoate glycosyltransferase